MLTKTSDELQYLNQLEFLLSQNEYYKALNRTGRMFTVGQNSLTELVYRSMYSQATISSTNYEIGVNSDWMTILQYALHFMTKAENESEKVGFEGISNGKNVINTPNIPYDSLSSINSSKCVPQDSSGIGVRLNPLIVSSVQASHKKENGSTVIHSTYKQEVCCNTSSSLPDLHEQIAKGNNVCDLPTFLKFVSNGPSATTSQDDFETLWSVFHNLYNFLHENKDSKKDCEIDKVGCFVFHFYFLKLVPKEKDYSNLSIIKHVKTLLCMSAAKHERINYLNFLFSFSHSNEEITKDNYHVCANNDEWKFDDVLKILSHLPLTVEPNQYEIVISSFFHTNRSTSTDVVQYLDQVDEWFERRAISISIEATGDEIKIIGLIFRVCNVGMNLLSSMFATMKATSDILVFGNRLRSIHERWRVTLLKKSDVAQCSNPTDKRENECILPLVNTALQKECDDEKYQPTIEALEQALKLQVEKRMEAEDKVRIFTNKNNFHDTTLSIQSKANLTKSKATMNGSYSKNKLENNHTPIDKIILNQRAKDIITQMQIGGDVYKNIQSETVYEKITEFDELMTSFLLEIDECDADSSNTLVNKRDVLWFINELKLRLNDIVVKCKLENEKTNSFASQLSSILDELICIEQTFDIAAYAPHDKMKEKEIEISILHGKIIQLEENIERIKEESSVGERAVDNVSKKSMKMKYKKLENKHRFLVSKMQNSISEKDKEIKILKKKLCQEKKNTARVHTQQNNDLMQHCFHQDTRTENDVITGMNNELKHHKLMDNNDPNKEAEKLRLHYLVGIIRDLERKLTEQKQTTQKKWFGSLSLFEASESVDGESCSSPVLSPEIQYSSKILQLKEKVAMLENLLQKSNSNLINKRNERATK